MGTRAEALPLPSPAQLVLFRFGLVTRAWQASGEMFVQLPEMLPDELTGPRDPGSESHQLYCAQPSFAGSSLL